MTPDACRQALLVARPKVIWRWSRENFALARLLRSRTEAPAGGQLDVICDWLDLPRLAVVDVSQLEGCRLPQRPAADGLLLDRVSSEAGFYRVQTLLESLWGIPVFGGMEEAEALRGRSPRWPRGKGRRAGWARRWATPCADERRRSNSSLGRAPAHFLIGGRRRSRPGRIGRRCAWPLLGTMRFTVIIPRRSNCWNRAGRRCATFRRWATSDCPRGPTSFISAAAIPSVSPRRCPKTNAWRRLCGSTFATASGFMPKGADWPICASRSNWPMAGDLPCPAFCRQSPARIASRALRLRTRLELRHPNWLGSVGTRLRGYLNDRWTIVPTGPLRVDDESAGQLNLVGRHQAIGSRVHLDFATDPAAVERFFAPHAAALELAAARAE